MNVSKRGESLRPASTAQRTAAASATAQRSPAAMITTGASGGIHGRQLPITLSTGARAAQMKLSPSPGKAHPAS
jgi:hypothetical protein